MPRLDKRYLLLGAGGGGAGLPIDLSPVEVIGSGLPFSITIENVVIIVNATLVGVGNGVVLPLIDNVNVLSGRAIYILKSQIGPDLTSLTIDAAPAPIALPNNIILQDGTFGPTTAGIDDLPINVGRLYVAFVHPTLGGIWFPVLEG